MFADVTAHRPKLRRRHEHTAALLAAERARDHTAGALDRVERELKDAHDGQAAHQQYRAAHCGELTKLTNTDGRIHDRLEQLVDALAADRPRYLSQLGPPPEISLECQQWRRAVRNVAVYRAQNNVTDPRRPFGQSPTEPVAQAAWQQAKTAFALHVRQVEIARDSVSRSQQRDQGYEIEL